MLYREIIAVFSQNNTKHINTVCGQNVEMLNVKLVVHIVTTGLYIVSYISQIVSFFPKRLVLLLSDVQMFTWTLH